MDSVRVGSVVRSIYLSTPLNHLLDSFIRKFRLFPQKRSHSAYSKRPPPLSLRRSCHRASRSPSGSMLSMVLQICAGDGGKVHVQCADFPPRQQCLVVRDAAWLVVTARHFLSSRAHLRTPAESRLLTSPTFGRRIKCIKQEKGHSVLLSADSGTSTPILALHPTMAAARAKCILILSNDKRRPG